MAGNAESILAHLQIVIQERQARAVSPHLQKAVMAIKRYQQQRFAHTYADLLAQARYAGAVNFFLDELYGPQDFSQRDAQFARVVPAIARLFPQEVVNTVDTLASLHALSETLDTEMGRHLGADVAADAKSYVAAWKATGRADERQRQIDLMLSVGQSLDVLTRKPFLKQGLRMMRAPAAAAGLSALQAVLEKGFENFQRLRGAQEFLSTVSQRERALVADFFGEDEARMLEQLP